jgi:hypothetical protein
VSEFSPDHLTSLAKLTRMVRQVTREKLAVYSGLSEVRIEDCEKSLPVFKHWLGLILVSGAALKLTVKVHYRTAEARTLAAQSFRKSPGEITPAQAADFIKEYCNLVGGHVKRELERASVDAGISLPLVTRGFDELFFPPPDNARSFERHWRLVAGEADLVISCLAMIYDWGLVGRISGEFSTDEGESGEVIFL